MNYKIVQTYFHITGNMKWFRSQFISLLSGSINLTWCFHEKRIPRVHSILDIGVICFKFWTDPDLNFATFKRVLKNLLFCFSFIWSFEQNLKNYEIEKKYLSCNFYRPHSSSVAASVLSDLWVAPALAVPSGALLSPKLVFTQNQLLSSGAFYLSWFFIA